MMLALNIGAVVFAAAAAVTAIIIRRRIEREGSKELFPNLPKQRRRVAHL